MTTSSLQYEHVNINHIYFTYARYILDKCCDRNRQDISWTDQFSPVNVTICGSKVVEYFTSDLATLYITH